MKDYEGIPLFMTNEEWYTVPEDGMFFDDGRGYHLADGVPQEVADSYHDFYSNEPITIEYDGKEQQITLR